MSASARPLPDERDDARPPEPAPVAPLRSLRAPRRPPPEAIRRRRAIALVCIVAVLGLAVTLVLGLGGGGGGASSSGDVAKITSILRAGTANPASLCDHLSAGMSRAIGGRAACVSVSPKKGPNGTVIGVEVAGDAATASVRTATVTERYAFRRERGAWRVDDVR